MAFGAVVSANLFTLLGGLALGCATFLHATQLSLIHIREKASLVRKRLALL